MSNKLEHILVGAGIGLALYAIHKNAQAEPLDAREAFACGAIGAFGGLLPDLIEPATGPTHRASAHSLAAAGLLLATTNAVWNSETVRPEQKLAASSLMAGCISHLILDATTPANLPLA